MSSIDPGNVPGGLFWTVPFAPPGSVRVDLDNATASMRVTNIQTLDFHTLVDDLLHHAATTTTASFDVEWSGALGQFSLRDTTNGFTGEYIATGATIAWSSSSSVLSFTSAQANTSQSLFAAIGHERNGVFFPQGSQ